MKKAVIYARYSSDKQNEQSISGQVDVCTKWAQNNNITIVHVYHDSALTGTTDKRPDFQRMIKDSKSGKFDYIIVYKLDRFARNRYDSAIYKSQLKKHNVKVLSAMESIADGPEGIILESVLEGMAEFYSANLSQNVLRGMHQRAEQAKFLGGVPPLGYKIDQNKNFVIDEKTSSVVNRIFEMYADGTKLKDMANYLNDSGYRTPHGNKFTTNSFNTILKNKKYIGIYENMGIEIHDAIPPLVTKDLFFKVQKKLEENKHAPARSKGTVNFYLTGKLFCGECGHNMAGDSGTSKSKSAYYYYSCVGKKRKNGCKKKSVKKDWIEQLITDITINQVLTDDNIEYLSEKAFELYEKERNDTSELTSLKKALKDTQKTIDNIMNAIEQGIITPTTKQRLIDAEEQKNNILVSISKEEIKKPPLSKNQIAFFLFEMRNQIFNSEEKIDVIINTFVNAVYLYDDKLIITFNFKDGENLKKLELSELEKFGFDNERFTIAILSELFMFAIAIKLHSK